MDYFDLSRDLTREERSLRDAAHTFADEVMRPVSRELDDMTAEEVIAEDSPLWGFLEKAYENGYHALMLPEEVGGADLTPRQSHIVTEELAWGSFGLSVLLGVASLPFSMAARLGREDLIEEYVVPFCECDDGSMRGCWAITEPDHGSDALVGEGESYYRDPSYGWNVQATLDGDEWVLEGQKSAWVSGGSIANYALLFAGVRPEEGLAGGGVFFCPLDVDGVRRGDPTRKMGQRDLNQGEIFFDGARIPREYLLVGENPEMYQFLSKSLLALANTGMSNSAVGLARAAFEEAYGYAQERVQGGKPLIEHDSMKQRLFDMFSKVETARAISRRVALFNGDEETLPLVEYGTLAKIRCTELAFEVAHEAVQVLGGNGLTRDYWTEKFFRDARATLIEDGNNEMLALAGGKELVQSYPRSESEVSLDLEALAV